MGESTFTVSLTVKYPFLRVALGKPQKNCFFLGIFPKQPPSPPLGTFRNKMWILAKFRNKNVNFLAKKNGHQQDMSFSQKTRAPAKKAEPIMWNPEKRGAWCHSVHFRSNSHKFPAKLDGHWPGAAPLSNLYQFNVKFLRCSSTGGKSGLSVAGAAASH